MGIYSSTTFARTLEAKACPKSSLNTCAPSTPFRGLIIGTQFGVTYSIVALGTLRNKVANHSSYVANP